MNFKVMVLGDSLLKRIQYDSQSNRFRTLQDDNPEKIEREFNLKIINKSKMGCTIDKGLEILNRILGQEKFDYALLEYGGNDCDYLWHEIAQDPQKKHYPKNEPQTFQKNLQKMIELCKMHKIKPILCTLPPIIAEWYFNRIAATEEKKKTILQWLEEDVQILYRTQEMYSRIVEQVAQKIKCPLIDLRQAFLQERNLKRLYCSDGIHPNQEGHRVIYEEIRKFCQNFLAIPNIK
ncbi:MAG: GDSL-type esterase/lipase family protein [Clostridia bacterium]|nr:GDSL-type esterase/lipase family protein [Clostridia bacterium]